MPEISLRNGNFLPPESVTAQIVPDPQKAVPDIRGDAERSVCGDKYANVAQNKFSVRSGKTFRNHVRLGIAVIVAERLNGGDKFRINQLLSVAPPIEILFFVYAQRDSKNTHNRAGQKEHKNENRDDLRHCGNFFQTFQTQIKCNAQPRDNGENNQYRIGAFRLRPLRFYFFFMTKKDYHCAVSVI